MSPEAVGLAALLHVLVALALWWMAVYRPATVPPEDPVEITFEQPPEQPKPPPEPPKPPPPQAQKPPQPPPPATPPVEGLKPPAELEADKATQRRPSGEAPKDIAGPQPDSMEREVPAPQPPPPPPQIEAKPEPKPTPPAEQKPAPQSPPPEIAAAQPEALPPPPPPTPREQPAPQPAPPKPSTPTVTSVQPQQKPPPQPTPPKPPPSLSPHPQLRPSPLTSRPQQQPPAIANRGDAPSSSPFVNPADEKNRATAEQNYLWEVVRKLRGYRYHANVPMSEGLTVVVVVIARDGRLLNVQVVRSSGVAAMDQGVLDGVRQGSPYTPLPPSIAGPSATFRLPLVSVPEGR